MPISCLFGLGAFPLLFGLCSYNSASRLRILWSFKAILEACFSKTRDILVCFKRALELPFYTHIFSFLVGFWCF
ncbi:hypothetical protein F5B21DRAFT_487127 [Xylaria acuta]|nr:hypothetical protein F5B21DRAFT_487127 [Xylaria acuta]